MKLLIDSELPATPPDELLGRRPAERVKAWIRSYAVTEWKTPTGWEIVSWRAVRTVERPDGEVDDV